MITTGGVGPTEGLLKMGQMIACLFSLGNAAVKRGKINHPGERGRSCWVSVRE